MVRHIESHRIIENKLIVHGMVIVLVNIKKITTTTIASFKGIFDKGFSELISIRLSFLLFLSKYLDVV